MARFSEVESTQEILTQPTVAGYEVKRALARYAETVAAAEKATRLAEQCEDFIEMVNAGQLPAGHMVVTRLTSGMPLWAVENEQQQDRIRESNVLRVGGDFVYRPDETGEYVFAGEVATDNTEIFLGDMLVKVDGGLVVVNSERQVGVASGSEIDIVNLLDDPLARTTGGTHQERFNSFLSVLDEVKDGSRIYYDRSW